MVVVLIGRDRARHVILDDASSADVTQPGGAAPRLPSWSARHSLLAYALRRMAVGVALAFAVSVLVFLAVAVLPGDAARAVLGGGRATDAQLETVRAQLGLDQPLVQRYVTWASGIVHGNLGDSLVAGRPVTEVVGDGVRNTVVLAAVTLVLLIPLSIGLGLLSGLRAGGVVDTAVSASTLGGIALPEFVVGTGLILVFAVRWPLLPPVSLVAPGETALSHPTALVLPVATLLVVGLAYTTRLVRAGVVEVAQSDYVQLARLYGLPSHVITTRYVLRNSVAMSIQSFTQTAQWLLGGVVVVEVVFAYPGLGTEIVNAVFNRDLPMVQSLVFVLALVFITLNTLADIAVVAVVPRLRTST